MVTLIITVEQQLLVKRITSRPVTNLRKTENKTAGHIRTGIPVNGGVNICNANQKTILRIILMAVILNLNGEQFLIVKTSLHAEIFVKTCITLNTDDGNYCV